MVIVKKKVPDWRVVQFKFDQFVSKLRARFLACVFFSFSRILEVFVLEFVF